jgi:hypothetical protein
MHILCKKATQSFYLKRNAENAMKKTMCKWRIVSGWMHFLITLKHLSEMTGGGGSKEKIND